MNLVDRAACLEINRSGVDASVDLQQRHTHATDIPLDERPEAPVCIAIFGADAGMYGKGSDSRDLEDCRLQYEFAARDDDIGLDGLEKCLRLGGVRTRDDNPGNGVEIGRVPGTQPLELSSLPLFV